VAFGWQLAASRSHLLRLGAISLKQRMGMAAYRQTLQQAVLRYFAFWPPAAGWAQTTGPDPERSIGLPNSGPSTGEKRTIVADFRANLYRHGMEAITPALRQESPTDD
jgi:hypothetical protein